MIKIHLSKILGEKRMSQQTVRKLRKSLSKGRECGIIRI